MTTVSRAFCIYCLTLGLWAPAANAQPSVIEHQTTQLREYGGLGDYEARCKSKPSVSIDEATFAAAAASPEHSGKVDNLYRQCSKPVRAVTEWCATGFDQNVQEQITAYVCQYSPDEPKLELKDGTLTLTTDWTPEPNDWSKNAVGALLTEGDFTVAQALLIKNDTGRINDAMADMSRRCERTVNWTVDWNSFRGELTKRIGSTNEPAIWQQCSAPLVALEALCTNGQSKLMGDQVTDFECHFDADVDAAMVLDGKTLSLTSNFSAGGLKEWASHLVGDTLRDGEFSVRQAAFMRDEDAHLQDLYSALADKKCNTQIPWTIDWAGFVPEVERRLAKDDRTSIYASCGVPLNRLADICESDPANKVEPMIDAFSCVYGGDGMRKLTLDDGKLTYQVDFSADDAYGAVDAFLIDQGVIQKRPAPKQLSPKDLASIRRILGQGANIQQCYKGCAVRCQTQACKNECRSGCN